MGKVEKPSCDYKCPKCGAPMKITEKKLRCISQHKCGYVIQKEKFNFNALPSSDIAKKILNSPINTEEVLSKSIWKKL